MTLRELWDKLTAGQRAEIILGFQVECFMQNMTQSQAKKAWLIMLDEQFKGVENYV